MMEQYTFLRAFADSWMLLVIFAVFIFAVIYAFRPGSKKVQNEAANSIFRNEKRPAPDVVEAPNSPNIKEA